MNGVVPAQSVRARQHPSGSNESVSDLDMVKLFHDGFERRNGFVELRRREASHSVRPSQRSARLRTQKPNAGNAERGKTPQTRRTTHRTTVLTKPNNLLGLLNSPERT